MAYVHIPDVVVTTRVVFKFDINVIVDTKVDEIVKLDIVGEIVKLDKISESVHHKKLIIST